MGAVGSTLVVNSGYVVNDGNGGANYTVTRQSAPGTITPAALAVTYTASDVFLLYGVTPSATLPGSVSAQGLQGSDTLASVTAGAVSFTTTATAQSPVGSYAITGARLSANSGNYTFSFGQASGNATALTIDPATLAIAAMAQSRTYGAANPNFTYTETGLVNGDTLSGSLVTGATAASNVGTYAITQGSLSAGSNYVVNYTPANLSVTPASLTVTYTANPATSIYGNVPTGLSGGVGAAGLVNGDTLSAVTSGSATFTTTADATSNVGNYAVTGSGLAANSGNYAFSFAQAPGNSTALVIVPRALTLTADPLSRGYGSVNPTSDTATATPSLYIAPHRLGLRVNPTSDAAITASADATTGLVNGDTVASESVTSPATATSNVGTYALNGANAQFSSGLASNYAIDYAVNPTGLTITPAALTITYTATAASSTYGAAPTGLTGSTAITGLVAGDTAAQVTDGSAMWTTPATATSSVGSYAINGSGIGLASTNYTLSPVQAASNATALTVSPASLTILYTANPTSRALGAANPALTGTETASGLVNDDTLGSVTSGMAVFTTPATRTSAAGQYAINGSGLTGSSANYTYTYDQAEGNATALTIAQSAVTIPDTARVEIMVIENLIEANLPDQISDAGSPERQKAKAAVQAALKNGEAIHPRRLARSLINDQRVTSAAPITDQVTTDGNPSLWNPGAQK